MYFFYVWDWEYCCENQKELFWYKKCKCWDVNMLCMIFKIIRDKKRVYVYSIDVFVEHEFTVNDIKDGKIYDWYELILFDVKRRCTWFT